MKKNNKAFTLIELLAIIVILAIIAVITVPIILNIIENSRKGASIDSAYGYRDSIQQYYLSKSVNGDFDEVLSGEFTKNVSELEDISVSGTKPTDGWVKISKGQVVDYSLKFGDYIVNYDVDTNNATTTKNGEIETSPVSWFTYETNDNNTVTITGFSGEWEVLNNDDKTNIIIPSKINGIDVEVIGENAFSKYMKNVDVTSVVLPSSLKKLENGAFGGTSIKNITIPNSVKTIGNGAFVGTSLQQIVIPNSVATIGDSAFENISTLTKVKIGTSVESIGRAAFYNTSLQEVVIPDCRATIGDNALGNISTLTKVKIGKGITITATLFWDTNNIKEVEIGVKDIPNQLFQNKTKLEKLVLNDGVETIGNSTFQGTNLEEVVIPDSVISIGFVAFQNISKLKTVIIGKGVTTINSSAFGLSSGDNILNNVYISKENATITEDYLKDNNCFAGRDIDGKVRLLDS